MKFNKLLCPQCLCLFSMVISQIAIGADRPNVLFIAADDLRMNLGCYGDDFAATPNLDKLASHSMVFDRAYCQFSSCNASRASLLTGMRPDTISVWSLNDHFRKTAPDVITLPQHFKANGYHTESIGKIYHNYGKMHDNEKSWSVPARMDQVDHFADYAIEANSRQGKAKGIAAENSDVSDDKYADGQITDDGIATIKKLANSKEPFFLAVGFLKPHSPYNAPKKYWDLYDGDRIKPAGKAVRAKGLSDLNWYHYREITTFRDVPDHGKINKPLATHLRHGYYAATSYLDANVGRLLSALKETGLSKNTIVVFWSDHGYHLGENRHWTKVTPRELDAHVPLIFHVPGQKNGRTSAIVEYIDIYPTLAELCDLPQPAGLDGDSFNEILQNPKLNGKDAAFTQVLRPWPTDKTPSTSMGYSLRTRQFRYTRWVDIKTRNTISEELYNHQTDWMERDNLIKASGYQATAKQLRLLMDKTVDN